MKLKMKFLKPCRKNLINQWKIQQVLKQISFTIFEFRNDYKNVSDEIVVCGDDVVEEGGTIEDDSAFDFIGSTQYPQTP